MRLLVCGDRNWSDRAYLYRILDEAHSIKRIVCLIEGEAPGADRMAKAWASARGVPVEPYPAEWAQRGPCAGPHRNRMMIIKGNPDLVFAFHEDIKYSVGTKDMLYCANTVNIPWELFPQ